MTKKSTTVAELKEWLNGLSDDFIVRVSVVYDNCEHVQNLNDVYVYGNQVTLTGNVKE